MEILFQKKSVPAVMKVEVAFWNEGNTTVNDAEVEEPLSIHLENCTLLKVDQIESSHSGVKPSVLTLVDSASIKFSYLNSGDWLFLVAYCEPTNDENIVLSAGGYIRGVKYISDKSGVEIIKGRVIKDLAVILPMTLFVLLSGVISVAKSMALLNYWTIPPDLVGLLSGGDEGSPWFGLGFGFVAVSLGLFGFILNLMRLFRGVMVPKELRKIFS
jgi:hypothetical protein